MYFTNVTKKLGHLIVLAHMLGGMSKRVVLMNMGITAIVLQQLEQSMVIAIMSKTAHLKEKLAFDWAVDSANKQQLGSAVMLSCKDVWLVITGRSKGGSMLRNTGYQLAGEPITERRDWSLRRASARWWQKSASSWAAG